ncbi:MAG: hypothetical protein WB710_10265, partial [Stellaceae bacterium]
MIVEIKSGRSDINPSIAPSRQQGDSAFVRLGMANSLRRKRPGRLCYGALHGRGARGRLYRLRSVCVLVSAMHDIRWIREHATEFDRGLARRGLGPESEDVLALDHAWRAAETRVQEAKALRNKFSRDIGAAKRAGTDVTEIEKMIAAGRQLESDEATEAARLRKQLDDLLAGLPNLPADDVPDGVDETANLVLRRVGEPPPFDLEPRSHEAIGERLGMMDFASAGKLSGSRFVVLRQDLARLERALAQFMLDLHTREFGYEEISPPLLVRDEAVFGTGQLPKAAEDMFRT